MFNKGAETYNFASYINNLKAYLVILFYFDFGFFLWMPSFKGNWVSLMGFRLSSRAGVDGNAHYQAQELHITTLANPGIKTNFLPSRPVQS